MLFRFTTFNHCRQGQIIVEDITRILGQQLIALGHEVDWSNDDFILGPDAMNVVLESFADDPRTLARMAAARSAGCRFLIVATEEPTAAGFNHGLEPAMVDRQNAFPAAAKLADGILHLMPGDHVTRWYAQHASAAYAEIGYAPGLVEDPDDIEPDHDFGFYGKMSWRRDQILRTLEAISKTEILKILTLDVPRRERDATMRRARVIVQVRANEEWGMVSSTRCATALSFGRPVVAEPHPFSKPWDEVVHFSTSIDSFYSDAMDAARAWAPLHAIQMNRFKNKLSPEICIGRPLREIGITKGTP